MNELILEAKNIRKTYDMPTGNLKILKGIDFEVFQGEMSFIIGKSGSGKSTLLHLLGGLDSVSGGKILFEGDELAKMSELEISQLRANRLGFVFQSFQLLPELTLFENVLLPSMIAKREDKAWAKEMLKRVKLWSRQDHYPSELSGGEQQRAAIARALVNRPSVVLCDEPTGNLDEDTSEEIYSLIKDLNSQENQAFVVVTHDESWAWRHAHVFRLQDGVLSRGSHGEVQIEQA